MAISVAWEDGGREAKNPANPAYPQGVDIDLSEGVVPACAVPLDYPAPRCGVWQISCSACGRRIAVTAAGRRDDPRSVLVACRYRPH